MTSLDNSEIITFSLKYMEELKEQFIEIYNKILKERDFRKRALFMARAEGIRLLRAKYDTTVKHEIP